MRSMTRLFFLFNQVHNKHTTKTAKRTRQTICFIFLRFTNRANLLLINRWALFIWYWINTAAKLERYLLSFTQEEPVFINVQNVSIRQSCWFVEEWSCGKIGHSALWCFDARKECNREAIDLLLKLPCTALDEDDYAIENHPLTEDSSLLPTRQYQSIALLNILYCLHGKKAYFHF